MILKGLKDRLRNRFNLALAEDEFTDLWQRSRLALVSLAQDQQQLATFFDRVLSFIEENKQLQLTESRMEYF